MELKGGVLLRKFKDKVATLFGNIREELDDHRTAINENTSEIQANYGLLMDIDAKLEKLSARLDALELSLDKNQSFSQIQPLNKLEKQAFLALYTTESPLTYDELARKSTISPLVISGIISSLIEKGVPLIKSYVSGKPFVKLNPEFKELQAKENILNLSLESYFEQERNF